MAIFRIGDLEHNSWRNRDQQMDTIPAEITDELEQYLDEHTQVSIGHTINEIEQEYQVLKTVKQNYTVELDSVRDKEIFTKTFINRIETKYKNSIEEILGDHPSGELVPTLKEIKDWPAGSLAFQLHNQNVDLSLSHFLQCFITYHNGTYVFHRERVQQVLMEIGEGVAYNILLKELEDQDKRAAKRKSSGKGASNITEYDESDIYFLPIS